MAVTSKNRRFLEASKRVSNLDKTPVAPALAVPVVCASAEERWVSERTKLTAQATEAGVSSASLRGSFSAEYSHNPESSSVGTST